jgi:hypothetical protein
MATVNGLLTRMRDKLTATSATEDTRALRNAIQDGLQMLNGEMTWRHRMVTKDFKLSAPYSTGSVSVNHDSKNVTGSGTTFTSAMVGQLISFGGDGRKYRIASVTNGTALVLEAEYLSPSAANLSASTYQIVMWEVTAPIDVETIIDMVDKFSGLHPVAKEPIDLEVLWGDAYATGSPLCFTTYRSGDDWKLRFYPAPEKATPMCLIGIRSVDDLPVSDDTALDWPPELEGLILLAALVKACETGPYSNHYAFVKAGYDTELAKVKSRDSRKRAMRYVGDPRYMPRDRQFSVETDFVGT